MIFKEKKFDGIWVSLTGVCMDDGQFTILFKNFTNSLDNSHKITMTFQNQRSSGLMIPSEKILKNDSLRESVVNSLKNIANETHTSERQLMRSYLQQRHKILNIKGEWNMSVWSETISNALVKHGLFYKDHFDNLPPKKEFTKKD